MRKVFTLILFVFCATFVQAQMELKVVDFSLRKGNTSFALPDGMPTLSSYSLPWSAIVITFPEELTELNLQQFEISTSGMTELGGIVLKDREIWIYVNSYAKLNIKITHPNYGTIKYKSKDNIIANAVYILKLSNHDNDDLVTTKDKTFIVKGVVFDMVFVTGGTFRMGCTSDQGGKCEEDEMPAHYVTLSDYYIGRCEVTQELWTAVMGSNPSHFIGKQRPVERISWLECQEFVRRLSELTGYKFRLPTEAEWEFAARGGNDRHSYRYSGNDTIDKVSWYAVDNDIKKAQKKGTSVVAKKAPNELGLYDMSGNVFEWCEDWFGNYTYESQMNPKGPDKGSYKVARGGSWINQGSHGRVAYRSFCQPVTGFYYLGLRLAMTP